MKSCAFSKMWSVLPKLWFEATKSDNAHDSPQIQDQTMVMTEEPNLLHKKRVPLVLASHDQKTVGSVGLSQENDKKFTGLWKNDTALDAPKFQLLNFCWLINSETRICCGQKVWTVNVSVLSLACYDENSESWPFKLLLLLFAWNGTSKHFTVHVRQVKILKFRERSGGRGMEQAPFVGWLVSLSVITYTTRLHDLSPPSTTLTPRGRVQHFSLLLPYCENNPSPPLFLWFRYLGRILFDVGGT